MNELCVAAEASCLCRLPDGHEGPHVCGLDRCGGSWTTNADGSFDHAVLLPGGFEPSILGVLQSIDHIIDRMA